MLSAIQQFFTDLWDSLTQTMSNPDMAAQLVQPISGLLQLLTPLLALFILIRCGRSLLRGKIEEEVWGYLVTADQTAYPLPHWENLIGRSSRCDVVLNFPTVSRSHAALIRDNAGQWQLHPLNAKNGVLLNGTPITEPEPVQDGDLFDMGGLVLAFLPANEEELHAQAQRRTKPGRFISPGVTLLLLTLFQATLCFKLLLAYQGNPDAPPILPCFGVLAGSMWFLYLLYRILKRRGFEIETIAFFLTTLCLTITANGIPKSLAKQTVCIVLGLVVFFFMSLMLRNLELAKWFRWPAAACSTAMIFVVQVMLNVFGSTDLLPLTGVTFPFVSCGGSSMISCWALLAYIKASDTRQNSALAVKLPKRVRHRREDDLPPEPPQETDAAMEDTGPVIPQDGPLYTDADDWQRYFKWEDDDE